MRAEYAGGFVGNNTGSITKAYAIARVSGSKQAGGFAVANSGTISYAYSAGTTRIQNTAPSFVWGAQTPENCFMYDYNGGQQGGSLAGLNNETLTANGFAKAASYQTPVLEGALYVENFKESVIVGGTPSTQGVIVTGGKESKVVYGVEQTALEGGYTVTVYVTDGAGRFGLSGTALVKYVVTNSSGAAVSCATVTVTI